MIGLLVGEWALVMPATAIVLHRRDLGTDR